MLRVDNENKPLKEIQSALFEYSYLQARAIPTNSRLSFHREPSKSPLFRSIWTTGEGE